jgi:hypothetical protein
MSQMGQSLQIDTSARCPQSAIPPIATTPVIRQNETSRWIILLLLCGDHPIGGIDVGWHAILASPARVLGHFYFFHDVVERLALFRLGGNAFDEERIVLFAVVEQLCSW